MQPALAPILLVETHTSMEVRHVTMEILLMETDVVVLVKWKHATGAVELDPLLALKLEKTELTIVDTRMESTTTSIVMKELRLMLLVVSIDARQFKLGTNVASDRNAGFVVEMEHLIQVLNGEMQQRNEMMATELVETVAVVIVALSKLVMNVRLQELHAERYVETEFGIIRLVKHRHKELILPKIETILYQETIYKILLKILIVYVVKIDFMITQEV
jgi:hypothetical protein